MIVSCPTCSTHYSHTAESALEIGRCSQCDARFPVSGQKRRYVVMPAVTPVTPDPLLAAGLAETQTRVDRQAENEAPDLPAPADGIPSEPSGGQDDEFFDGGMDDDDALFEVDEAAAESPSVDPVEAAPDDPEPAPATRRPSHPVREAIGVFLLAGLGGAAGFQGSLQFGLEPQKAVGVGLAVGLTLGWAWIRWAERKR